MSINGRNVSGRSTATDREILVARKIDAPRELVFEAFTDARHLSQW